MINRRRILNKSEFEYQCLHCGWWWNADQYCAGAFLAEIRDREINVANTAWACDFCLLFHLEKTKLVKTVK